MAWAESAYEAVRGYTNAPKLGAWIQSNPELHDLYKYVVELLENDGEANGD